MVQDHIHPRAVERLPERFPRSPVLDDAGQKYGARRGCDRCSDGRRRFGFLGRELRPAAMELAHEVDGASDRRGFRRPLVPIHEHHGRILLGSVLSEKAHEPRRI